MTTVPEEPGGAPGSGAPSGQHHEARHPRQRMEESTRREEAKKEAAEDEEPEARDADVQAELIEKGRPYPGYVSEPQRVVDLMDERVPEMADKADAARDKKIPDRDGLQEIGGRRVYVRTMRLGIPPGTPLWEELHAANGRQVIEDALKAGERVDGDVELFAIWDDKLNNETVVAYLVPLLEPPKEAPAEEKPSAEGKEPQPA
jgi:hypothetical protein